MGKHILVVSPYFYPEGGGLERYAFNMAQELAKKDKVKVLCMTRGTEKIEEINGITVYRVKPEIIISNTPISLRFIFKVARAIKDSKLVITHTPVPFAADIASFFAKLKGIPIEIVYHTVGLKKGDKILDFVASVYSLTLERITLRGSTIIAVSGTVFEYFRGRGYHSRISYPMPDITKFNLSKTCKRENAVLFVGQLGKYHKFKNLNLLIRAFAEVSEEFPEWKLWVVGKGDMVDEYKNLVEKLGITEKVHFFGGLGDEELSKIYSKAKLLVLPSTFPESFGMVVAEALAFGTPVIVSPYVGAKFLVDDRKNGVILKDLKEESLENAMKNLMRNPKALKRFSHIAKHKMRASLKGETPLVPNDIDLDRKHERDTRIDCEC
ncbi:glycosyltransferase family 4 protein [Thermococcus aggregans]|uniref:Glycosyltransferase family 4 protein n=1 Tax=Thermococcus aggregans TaxID=110163 RepID=A0A9E7SP34_THEAG|nr:glycosyltransferase family 4 protein [Thermococcus aggregans]USS41093.1 glycosyltransferase family 4 protein [Thermococcus aggregans]